jgi:hypothetical protein
MVVGWDLNNFYGPSNMSVLGGAYEMHKSADTFKSVEWK